MATNICREEADQVAVPVSNGAVSGDVVHIGDLPAVLLVDEGSETEGEATVKFNGSIYADVSIAVDAGDVIYVHSGSPQTFNKTSSGGLRVGIALSETESGGGTIEVKLAK